jgi:hypothetical protein
MIHERHLGPVSGQTSPAWTLDEQVSPRTKSFIHLSAGKTLYMVKVADRMLN